MAKKIPPRIAVVIYDYQAMNPDELYLKKDELITILETIEDKGWLRGVVGNRHGIFPENVRSDRIVNTNVYDVIICHQTQLYNGSLCES